MAKTLIQISDGVVTHAYGIAGPSVQPKMHPEDLADLTHLTEGAADGWYYGRDRWGGRGRKWEWISRRPVDMEQERAKLEATATGATGVRVRKDSFRREAANRAAGLSAAAENRVRAARRLLTLLEEL